MSCRFCDRVRRALAPRGPLPPWRPGEVMPPPKNLREALEQLERISLYEQEQERRRRALGIKENGRER